MEKAGTKQQKQAILEENSLSVFEYLEIAD